MQTQNHHKKLFLNILKLYYEKQILPKSTRLSIARDCDARKFFVIRPRS